MANILIDAAIANLSVVTVKGLKTEVGAKTSAYTLTAADFVVTGDATSGTFAFTLPTAIGVKGQRYLLIKIDTSTNAITIATTSSQTISGATGYSLTTQWDRLEVISDGANWVLANPKSTISTASPSGGADGDVWYQVT